MSDIFPYGNDLSKPEQWVGHETTKSRKWHVRRAGGFPLKVIASQSAFIFVGVESFNIGIFSFEALGVQGGVKFPGKKYTPPKKQIIPGSGGGNDRSKRNLDKINDGLEKAKDAKDIYDNRPSDDPNTPHIWGEGFPRFTEAFEMWNQALRHTTLITADKPFSLSELNGSVLHYCGVEGEISLLGSLEVGYLRWPSYFGWKQIYNLGEDATIGLSGTLMSVGLMKMKGVYSPYAAEVNDYNIKDENGTPNYYQDGYRPLRKYDVALDYFRYLPPAGRPVPQSTIDMGLNYAKNNIY